MSPTNQARVWTFLALVCDNAAKRGRKRLGMPVGISSTNWGLCTTLNDLFIIHSITLNDRDELRRQLRTKEPNHKASFWWPVTPEGHRQRATICRQLAREATRHAPD